MTLAGLLTAGLAVASAGYALLAMRVLRAGSVARQRVGIALLLAAAWVAAGSLLLQPDQPWLFTLGRFGHVLAGGLLPVFLLIAIRGYVGQPLGRPLRRALFIVPVLTVAAAATNGWHGLLWTPGSTLRTEWGPWFHFVQAPYCYLLLGASILHLLLHSTAVPATSRRTVLLLAVAVAVPTAALLAYDFGSSTLAANVFPILFASLLPVYGWLILRERVVEFVPLAYETVFQNMSDPVLVVDERRRVISLNHCAESLVKMPETRALRATLDSLFGPDAAEIHRALDTGTPQRMLTTSGRFLHLQASRLDSGYGESGGQVLMFRDVSDVEKAQQEVRSSEKLLRTLIDHSVNGIVRLRWMTDAGGRRLRCVFANAAAGRFLHANPDILLQCDAEEIVLLACSGLPEDEARAIVDKFIADTRHGEVVDLETRVEGGRDSKWLRVIGEPVGDNVAVTFVDVTDRKAKELQMESIAWSDPLTGVLNRRGFEREAASRLSASRDDASGALLFIDLNDFKQINDRCGHEAGDRLLTVAADRLRKTLRRCDIIGRLGGDEFVALVPDVTPDLAHALAKRVTAVLEQRYRIGEAQLDCSASIGLALYPSDASTLTGLMRHADQAMYREKARTRAGISPVADVSIEKAG